MKNNNNNDHNNSNNNDQNNNNKNNNNNNNKQTKTVCLCDLTNIDYRENKDVFFHRIQLNYLIRSGYRFKDV